ncbi:putative ribonuclease H-like domain-containing protein [Tanacetum coccineum]
MDLENTQNNSLAKLPLLKQGEYDTWRLRIESYIQLQDYALWEIIEEGNSFKPVARTTTNEDGTSTTTIPGAVTAEQKILKKNNLKARSILMMTLPSEHLLTFNKHKDAKSLFEAIEARFGGNKATKKTQKTLLKLQKIGMHVVVWRNKSDQGLISFDDLYNNFKIVEPKVKRSVISSTNSGSQNLAFLSGHSSINDVNTANVHVSTSNTPVSTASTNNSTACLSDATIYAYLATQPKGSQVVHEDLEQIYKDDLDEMYLKWKLALLSIKARKFYQRTGKKIIINGSDTASYDKKKVECFNCHKLGHFARECKNPRSQENRNRSQDSLRRTVNVEESSSKAMLAIDGTGFDWSYMADEEASTNFALMAFSEIAIKRVSVEEQLVFYKKNESMLCDQIAVLKRDASFNELDIIGLKKQVERLKKEKEDNQFKIDNFENASKSLDQLIGNQISDNNKKGIGYNVPEFEGYGVKVNKGASENVSKEVKKTSDAPIIEDWVSDCDEDETVVLESLNVQKPKQADQPRKGTGQREVRPVWTNAMRVNHQNFSNSRRNFAPTAVLTKFGLVPFSTARQSFSRTTTPVSATSSFNTVVPSVNVAKSRTNAFQKSPSPLRRPFYQQTTLKNKILNNKVNTTKVISVNTVKGKRMTSAVGEQEINDVKPTAYWAWRPKIKMINHVSKNTGSCICKQFNYIDPTGRNKVLNSPYFMVKSWLVQDQTVLALAIPGQTTTGKESTNTFMAGSLTKTISPMIHPSQKVTYLEVERTSKESHAQTLTMLMKKVKRFGRPSSVMISGMEKKSIFEEEYMKLNTASVKFVLLGIYSTCERNGTSIQINMLVDKKYPLKKEILKKMINLKIEAEEESDMPSELIKFIKSQIAEQS